MRPAWLLVSNALFFAGYLPFFVHGELLKVKPFRLSGATGSPNHFKKKTSSDNDEATNPFVDDDDWGNPSPPEQVGPPQSLPPSNDDGDNWGNPTLPKQVDPQQFFAYTPENYNDTKVIDFLALWSTEIRSAYMAQQPPVPLATFYARDLLSWDSMICGVDECGCLNAPSLDYIRSKYPDHPSRAREIYFGVIAWDAYFKLPCVLRRAMEIAVQGMQDLCDELARTFFHPSEKMGGGWCIFGEVFGSIFALLLISSVVVLWPYLMGIGAEISEFAAQTLHEIAEWILPALAKNPSIDVLRSVFSWESFLWKYQYIDEVRQLAMNGPNIYSGLARASQTIWKIIMRIGEESPRVAAPLKTLWTRVIEYLENSYSQKYLEYLYGPDIWRSPVWIPRYPGPPRKRHEHDERSPDTELKGTPYVSVSDIQDQDVLRKFCPLCVRSPLSRSSQLNPEFESAGIENAVAFTERSHKLGSINVTRWHDVAGAAPHPIQLRYFSGQHMGYTINIGANSRIRKREELELSPEDEKQLLEAFVTIADALSREHRVGVLNVLTAYNFINPPTKEDFRGDPSIHKRRDSQDKGSSKIHKRAPEDFDQSPFEFSYPTKLAGHPIFHSRFKKNACGHTKYRPNYEANTKACREEVTEIGDEFLRHMKETVEVVNSPIHLKSSMDWPEGQPAPFVRSYKGTTPDHASCTIVSDLLFSVVDEWFFTVINALTFIDLLTQWFLSRIGMQTLTH
ncbi:hypothetical protein BDV96DRAFT_107377 [Lophiotrema nucula]|uniref:Uncharacterized protein n=1 Tax=Lophiotrema nucula TaxID=690887 RepID=A0A6A5Z3P2_9PLEO|nr:hypothetical protein BDV96DRAFT_107377 [Lophiotrema nucula]